jgi:AhpD family alkylhydroperoxidase
MNYAEISKETVSYLHKSYASLKNSPLNPSLRVLIELRTSQINGCAYCCHLHTEEARKLNIPQEKLDVLDAWHTSQDFSDAERLALQWCEAITGMDKNLVDLREQLFQYYSEREVVDLTACIAIMNALNRMAICLRD